MERDNHIRILFERYVAGQHTKKELDELFHHFNIDNDESLLTELISVEMKRGYKNSNEKELIAAITNRVEKNLFSQTRPRPIIKRLLPKLAIAATLLIALSFTIYFYIARKNISRPVLLTDNQIKVNPGSDRATLTLANGRSIALDSVSQGQLATQAGVVITKTGSGQLLYAVQGGTNGKAGYNTIRTPKGGQYQVILPDRSIVWLNAASSITFPTAFNGNSREVGITGEAYFQVAKNRNKPFRVKTAAQTVEVLGTHFNVNSYTDEPATVTTLEEGSVRVNLAEYGSNYNHAMTIAPGQQTAATKGKINVGTADLQTALAWKNNKIYFRQADIRSIMREVARWYNIEVEYKGNIPERRFTGGIYRTANLNELLKILMLNDIHFELQDKTLIVKP